MFKIIPVAGRGLILGINSQFRFSTIFFQLPIIFPPLSHETREEMTQIFFYQEGEFYYSISLVEMVPVVGAAADFSIRSWYDFAMLNIVANDFLDFMSDLLFWDRRTSCDSVRFGDIMTDIMTAAVTTGWAAKNTNNASANNRYRSFRLEVHIVPGSATSDTTWELASKPFSEASERVWLENPIHHGIDKRVRFS